MPELLGIGLPVWVLAILFLLSNKNATDFFKRILSHLGIVAKQKKETIKQEQEADLEAERWMRQRADWSADKAFDILEATIRDNQATIQRRDEVLMNLASSIQRNTATVAQQTDMIRILSQHTAKMDDRLDSIQSHIETRWLGGNS